MDTGGNINPTNPNAEKNSSTPYFHSVHLNKTKASEEKVYFTNVKKESKLKKNLEKNIEKSRKLLKTKPSLSSIPKKTLTKISLIAGGFILIILAIFLFINYAPTNKTQAEADSILISDPENGIEIYDKLIFHANSKEEKASLYLSRADTLSMSYNQEYSSQIISDVYTAENLVHTKTTALAISLYERLYGDKTKAEEWAEIAETREYSKSEIKSEESSDEEIF